MSEEKFTPPPGLPGPQELKHRRAEAESILNRRGLGLTPQPLAMVVNTLVRLVRSRLQIGDAEWTYFADLTDVESLEQLVDATAPKPKIILPGRDVN